MMHLVLSVFCLLASLQGATVPRPAAELHWTSADGQPTTLAPYKGKVVVLELMATTCPHCQQSAQVLNKLHKEYGPKGVQVLAVAFNPMAGMLVPDFVKNYQVAYPMGSTTREQVEKFLQHDPVMQLYVPQLVVIDRQGQIRVQTPPGSDPYLTSEAGIRFHLDKVLSEPAPKQRPVPTSSRVTTRKKAS